MQQIVRKLKRTYRALVKPSVVRNDGMRLFISDEIHPDIVRSIYKNGYERREIELLRSTLREDDIVLDIGAGIGQSAIAAAQKTRSKVYAVEANPDLIPLIKQNAGLNGVDIEIIHGAAGTEDGSAVFYLEDKFFASSLTSSGSARRVTVPVIGIGTLLEKAMPTYLNVDAEGAEFDILPLVTKAHVRCISAEMHDHNRLPGLIKRMEENGFKSMHYGSLMHFC